MGVNPRINVASSLPAPSRELKLHHLILFQKEKCSIKLYRKSLLRLKLAKNSQIKKTVNYMQAGL
jgi:hypothetical protein